MTMTAYVRMIGTKVCFTFPNGNFTMLERDETPANILQAVDQHGHYDGPIPDSIYLAYLVCESQGQTV